MLFLVQDGITNGAIYALLGLALVLVFGVTRVILIPQGEFVTYGALTYASLSSGQFPGTARLAMAMGIVAFGLDLYVGRKALHRRLLMRALVVNIALPAIVLALTWWSAGNAHGVAISIALSLSIVAMIGALSVSHRLPADRPHLGAGAADRLGRLSSGDAGLWAGVLRRRRPKRPADLDRFLHRRAAALHRPEHRGLRPDHRLHDRALAVFRPYADRKALRATAVNRLGARLVGIRTTLAGQIAFLMPR